MSKVMILGTAPEHLTERSRVEARSYRTWQLTEPLIKDGHEVYLVANYPPDNPAESKTLDDGNFHYLVFDLLKNKKRIRDIYRNFNPDAIIGAGFFTSLICASINFKTPMWLDIYGDWLCENQTRMAAYSTHRGIIASIELEKLILKRGDEFSSCSNPQKYAMVGRLAAYSRLNQYTLGYDFVHTIPPGGKLTDCKKNNILRGKIFAEDDFLVLWCGSYNIWTDPDVLFLGLEGAMKENPKIKYFSIGGPAVHPKFYEQFKSLVERSKFKENFKLCGWLPYSVKQYFAESDIGICIEAYHYETLLSSKTRIVDMMSSGLPVITTLGCELSYLLSSWNAAVTFQIGDHKQLSLKLLELSYNPELVKTLKENSLNVIKGPLSFEQTTEPLRKWVRNPKFAPDKFKTNFWHTIDNNLHWMLMRKP